MVAEFKIDPAIDCWYEEFERVRQLWIEWCEKNITRYKSMSPAWKAFVVDLHRQSIQLRELRPECFFTTNSKHSE